MGAFSAKAGMFVGGAAFMGTLLYRGNSRALGAALLVGSLVGCLAFGGFLAAISPEPFRSAPEGRLELSADAAFATYEPLGLRLELPPGARLDPEAAALARQALAPDDRTMQDLHLVQLPHDGVIALIVSEEMGLDGLRGFEVGVRESFEDPSAELISEERRGEGAHLDMVLRTRLVGRPVLLRVVAVDASAGRVHAVAIATMNLSYEEGEAVVSTLTWPSSSRPVRAR